MLHGREEWQDGHHDFFRKRPRGSQRRVGSVDR
jgi:hypothetical protein